MVRQPAAHRRPAPGLWIAPTHLCSPGPWASGVGRPSAGADRRVERGPSPGPEAVDRGSSTDPRASLRQQLTFPRRRLAAADGQLRRLMDLVGLDQLGARYPNLDAVEDWAHVLSGGEQQRVAIVRVLLQPPRLVLLDEATSATDLATEADLYEQLIKTGFTCISVGHRPSLRAFHTQELRLDGRGGWQLVPIAA
ncbi:MAG: ATP-binding cassette domain-containing protein [Synechococcaceae bacterium WB9_2_112]|nr:ATP-binding cassette domain-containing protein [Synechococcaceae bacterium WB9_2_112]